MSDFNINSAVCISSHVESELNTDDFIRFFQDVHGCKPFPWQVRLTNYVLEQKTWPKVIDLPTGSGKTSVIDTAVFALARHPDDSPRRIVFVIDRRIVVDQVCERARRIQRRLTEAKTPILKRVRDSLKKLSGGELLGVAALRGGVPVDDTWARCPDQPWVVVSTVDQFGSRLLFRGYGISWRMHPVHAGLAGNDCLVVLDEVHLSVPFAETLAQVSSLSSGLLPRRFTCVEMSATPTNPSTNRFELDPVVDLDECQELRRRVLAAKQAELVSIPRVDALPSAVLKIVKSIGRSNRTNPLPSNRILRLGVIVNRVHTAREIHNHLVSAGYHAYLLTGRMRPVDKIDILDRILPIVNPDIECEDDEFNIVVATQTIEVGADFSFDGLITECASIDSLRQRFGRLDRRGTWSERAGSPAQAWILGPKTVVDSKKPDPIYGESVKETWNELKKQLINKFLNVDSMSLRSFPNKTSAPKLCAPLLLNTHMNAWVQTNPEPIVQPSIDWFLHGINQRPLPEVSILWRRDRSAEALRLVVPRQAEMIQVPINSIQSWWFAEVDQQDMNMADVTLINHVKDVFIPTVKRVTNWVRWNGINGGVEEIESVGEIQPGDILVIDPAQGGLNSGTWDPSSKEPIEDLGDAVQLEYGNRVTLRLDAKLPYIESPPTPATEVDLNAPVSVSDFVTNWLQSYSIESNNPPNWISKTIERLLQNGFEIKSTDISGELFGCYYILIEKHKKTKRPLVDMGTMDGSDETGSFLGTGSPLKLHLTRVGERAGKIAERLGLEQNIVADLCLAGELHDLGKVDARFQMQLVGGDPIEFELRKGEPLAKSLPGTPIVRKYPKGMRHEVASVAMINSNQDVLKTAHDKDLVLHLVGTHHGFARPLPPIAEDRNPQTLTYEWNEHRMEVNSNLVDSTLAIEMADRFWNLVERYGYYGLAWLEAILRLADHQQSAEESAKQ